MSFETFWQRRVWLGMLCVCVLSSACSRDEKQVVPAKRGVFEFASKLEKRPAEHGREREQRAPDSTVYIDGVPMLVLTYLELPPTLPTRWRTLKSGKVVRRFRLAELVSALGADLAAVQQVHLYGGRDRISILDGDELRRMHEDILFSFTQSDRGKPRMHFPDEPLRINTRVDLLEDIAIYVTRKPPRHEGKYATLTFDDGLPIEGIPYASGDRPHGTRIYVDASLKTFVKRRSLPSPLAAPNDSPDEPSHYLLRTYVETLGVSWTEIKSIEFLGNADVLASFDAAALAKSPNLGFSLRKRSRGLLSLDLATATEPVQAIAIYVKTVAPDRAAKAHPPEEEGEGDAAKKK